MLQDELIYNNTNGGNNLQSCFEQNLSGEKNCLNTDSKAKTKHFILRVLLMIFKDTKAHQLNIQR